MIKKALFVSFLLVAPKLWAQPSELYYWDNNQGLINAQHCSIHPLDQTSFRVSEFTGRGKSDHENLRNQYGSRQSRLRNGSLVRIDSGRQGRQGYRPITVLGIVPESSTNENAHWISERGDQGFLFEQSLRPIEDYVLTPVHSEKTALPPHLHSAQWQVPFGESYLQISCPEHQENRSYLLFTLNDPVTNETLAQVGVHPEETSILSQHQSQYRENDADLAQLLIDELLEDFAHIKLGSSSRPLPRPEHLLLKSLPIAPSTEAETTEVQEGLRTVVCTAGASLNVRDESLDRVLFQAFPGEEVVVRQGFDNESITKEIGGETFEFVQVRFQSREASDQNTGFVAKNFIMTAKDCPFAAPTIVVRGPETTITGLDDEKCCEFPTVDKVTHPYTSGMRMFGARRGGGSRSHGAADLYRFRNEPIVAVAPGVVVRDLYYFYQGTYAIEVVHSGGFIVRYGETTNRAAQGVRRGAKVHMGQRLGQMGVVNSGCCRPMLHFELYRGNRTGALSVTNPPYNRRADLMNPTPYLLRWEREKFR
jgi:murein DD-endopeptidase MepM/ murein hydrolase activator NlpD